MAIVSCHSSSYPNRSYTLFWQSVDSWQVSVASSAFPLVKEVTATRKGGQAAVAREGGKEVA